MFFSFEFLIQLYNPVAVGHDIFHIQVDKVPEGNQPFFSLLFLGHTTPIRFLSVFLTCMKPAYFF